MMSEEFELKKGNFDINVKINEKHVNVNFEASWLKLDLNGKDLNIKLINALRRISMTHIPSYAFPDKCINIINNNVTACNNDYMRLRLGYLPVLGIDPKIYNLDEKYWKQVNFADPKRDKHENENNVEINIDAINNTDNIMNVTTKNMVVYINNELAEPYNKDFPILIIKLKPNNVFKCHMKAVLGIGKSDARWRSSRNTFYDEINDNNYCLTVEGNGQISEEDILIRTCKFLVKKMADIKTELKNQVKLNKLIKTKVMKIQLDNEDIAIGAIINYELQSHKNISRSASPKLDLQIDSIMLITECIDSLETPFETILECIDIVSAKCSHIGKLIYDLFNHKNKEAKNDNDININNNNKDVKEIKIKKVVKKKT